ncbi:MAG: hypothetical protein HZA54_18445 [Planctomycetes bacterium]|nr:hypothetical protein [Planctomycetota bacterium]
MTDRMAEDGASPATAQASEGAGAAAGAGAPRPSAAMRGARALLLVALVLVFGAPLLLGKYAVGHDFLFYLPRLVEFHENLRHGILFPRWAADLGAGHGQPLFLYYPPLFYYLCELWIACGLNLIWAVNLSCLALAAVAAAMMRRWAACHWGELGGALAATAYLFAPYVCVDLYVRHALAEFAAFAFYPIALDGIGRYARGGTRCHLLQGALGVAGVLWCHHPAALLFAPLVAGYGAWLAWEARSWRVLGGVAAAGGLGGLLSAHVLLPALLEREFVKLDLLMTGYPLYTNHFVYPWQLFAGGWSYRGSAVGDGGELPFGLGWAHLALLAAAWAFGWRERGRMRPGERALLGGATAAILLYCLAMLPLAQPLWDRVKFLQYMQFPWRLLAPVTVCLAFAAGAAGQGLAGLRAGRRMAACVAAFGLVLALNFAHARPSLLVDVTLETLAPGELARSEITVLSVNEFEPRWVTKSPPFAAEPVRVVEGTATAVFERRSPECLRVSGAAATAAVLEVATYWFPGWSARVNGQAAGVTAAAGSGYLRVALPTAGAYEVELTLERTGVQRAGLALAALGVLAMGGIALGWSWRGGHGGPPLRRTAGLAETGHWLFPSRPVLRRPGRANP